MKRQWKGTVEFRDKELGTCSVEFDDARHFRPANTHLFCCKCGTVWGKLFFPLSSHHHTTNVPCDEHGGGLFEYRWENHRFFISFSVEVLTHDFCIMYNWMENKIEPELMQDSGSMHIAVGTGRSKRNF